jgi:hypothetical protein
MQQKQRLKALDRFKAEENSVLVATDVAARGLDVKDVRWVGACWGGALFPAQILPCLIPLAQPASFAPCIRFGIDPS